MKKTIAFLACLLFTLAIVPLSASYAETEATVTTTDKTTNATTATKATTATTKAQVSGLTVSSSPEKTNLEGSKTTKITYTIKNTGNTTLKNITLKDSDITTKTIGTLTSLSAGQTKTFSLNANFSRDSVSEPVVTYTDHTGSKTVKGAPVKISLGTEESTESSLSATLSSDKTSAAADEEIKFTVLLKNNSTNTISDITVTDMSGTEIKTGVNISASASTQIEFTKKFTESTKVSVNASGKSSTNATVSTKSNEIDLTIQAASTAQPDTGLTILISSNETNLDKKGQVEITLEVKNEMSDAYTDIVIIDKATKNQLKTINSLSAKDTKSYTTTLTIDKTTTLQYEATAKYGGQTYTISSNNLEIIVASSGLFSNSSSAILIGSIIGIVLLLIIVTSIVLFVLSKKEKAKKKALGSQYSEKYKEPTPKRTQTEELSQPSAFSTFTIDEDITPHENQFDSEQNISNSFDSLSYVEVKKPAAPVVEPVSQEMLNELLGNKENNIKNQSLNNTQPINTQKSSAPMNYNDLDPDQ